MRISVKGRYAIISMIILAQKYNNENTVTVISISENLGISKIYLEQVFSLLKRGGIVSATKGAQGGYRLTRKPDEISLYDILINIETALFEETGKTLGDKYTEFENTLSACIYTPIDQCLKKMMEKITLTYLIAEYENHKNDNGFMYYI